MASLGIIISMTLSTLTLVVVALAPYFYLLQRRDSFRRRGSINSSTLSYCNCFAAGVFLSTCFLGLVPHTVEIEHKIHEQFGYGGHHHGHSHSSDEGRAHGWTHSLIDTNLIILLGFLLTLFIEQIVDFHQSTEIHENAAHRLCDLSARSCHKESQPVCSKLSKRERQIAPKDGENNIGDLNGGISDPLVMPADCTAITSVDEDIDANNVSLLTKQVVISEAVTNVGISSDLERTEKNRRHYNDHSHDGSSPLRSFLLLLAMSTHSFFEGIALGALNSFDQFLRLLISIMLHEVLCAFAYGLSLSRKRSRAGFCWAMSSSIFLASSIPLGMILMSLIGALENQSYSLLIRFILEGLAVGIFIYVACLEMLAHEFSPHSHSHNEPKDEEHHHHGEPSKALLVVLGAFVSFAVNVIIGH